MELKDIIKKSNLQTKIINPLNFFVKGISIHSDQVRNNFIFAAIKGSSRHGLDFIKDLLNYKNIAVVFSSWLFFIFSTLVTSINFLFHTASSDSMVKESSIASTSSSYKF